MSRDIASNATAESTDEKLITGPRPIDAVAPSLTFVALLLLWEFSCRFFEVPTWLLPTPSSIYNAFIDARGEMWGHTLVTLYETLVGFALSIVIAIPLAALIVLSPFLRNTIYPILLALQSVPKVAVAPLLALWIGFGTLSKILVVFLICFFPIIVGAATGLASVQPAVMDLSRSLSASKAQTFIKIRFPTALPHIFVGLKIAITLAVIGAVIGEFVGSESGLGYIILVSSSQANTPLAFAALVILTIMSIVLYYIVELIEKFLVPWAPKA